MATQNIRAIKQYPPELCELVKQHILAGTPKKELPERLNISQYQVRQIQKQLVDNDVDLSKISAANKQPTNKDKPKKVPEGKKEMINNSEIKSVKLKRKAKSKAVEQPKQMDPEDSTSE